MNQIFVNYFKMFLIIFVLTALFCYGLFVILLMIVGGMILIFGNLHQILFNMSNDEFDKIMEEYEK